MKAMILAAGEGTRLQPFTATRPKALVPVLNVPMLERLAAWLGNGGVTQLAVNAHHLPEVLAAHVENMALRAGVFPPITLFREQVLLGTGGGVVNTGDFWGEAPLLVWNGDIVADTAPNILFAEHGQRGALATLVTGPRKTGSHLLVDDAGVLCGIDSPRRGGRRLVRDPQGEATLTAFHGVSVLSPALRPMIARPVPFDLIDALLDAVEQGALIRTLDARETFWGSTGTPQQLVTLEAGLAERPELLKKWSPGG